MEKKIQQHDKQNVNDADKRHENVNDVFIKAVELRLKTIVFSDLG